MANAILKFRRGTLVPSLNISEPFFKSDTEDVYVGVAASGSIKLLKEGVNTGNVTFGNITTTNLTLSGSADIVGNLTISGSLIVGGAPVDTGSLAGVLSGSLIPSTGSTFSVGSMTQRWTTVYAEDLDISNGITATAVPYSGITSLPTLVSGSLQIDHNQTQNYTSSRHIDHNSINIIAGSGLSGGGFIVSNVTLTLNTGSAAFVTGSKTILNNNTVVSGSGQVNYFGLANLPVGIISGSTQLPSGIISGSTQLIPEFDSRYLNTGGDNVVSGSSQISFTGITNKPTLISGSSQLTSSYDSRYELQGSGFWSGSGQLPTGTVSGSNQVSSSFELRGSGILSSSVETFIAFSSSVDSRLDSATSGGLLNVVEDTTPQLGGNLDLNGNTISGSGDINFLGSITISGSSEVLSFTDVIDITGNANPNFSSVEVGNRLTVATPAFGGSRIGDAYLQTPSLDIGYNPAYTDSGAINFRSGSNQQTVVGMFTNPEGTVFTMKGFDDSIMVVDHTSKDAVSGSEAAESTIANTISFTNTWSYINDQGVQIYPGATTPVAETHFQILQNRNGAPRMGFYKAFYDGTTYNRIYDITADGDMFYENKMYISSSLIVSSSLATAISVTGSIQATGEIEAWAASDERLKIGMTRISEPLIKIGKLNGYTYDWDETKQDFHKGNDVGVSAQELQKVLPQLVRTQENGYLGVKYDKITALLIEAVKELTDEVNSLKQEIKELRDKK